MKKIGVLLFTTGIILLLSNFNINIDQLKNSLLKNSEVSAQLIKTRMADQPAASGYKYPDFYRGIYLTVNSANNMKKLEGIVARSKAAGINTMVMDVQIGKNNNKCMVPAPNVQFCRDNGIHPIARVVVFPDGLRKFPVEESYLENRLAVAEDSCKNGFREIQFDYIRFHDSGSTRRLTYGQRYKFVEDFITKARLRMKKYNVRIAADVFGRIPLNTDDIIGQKIESLDKVVDIICPMAYPSHYTWSKKYYSDPYYTVHKTSSQARLRSKNAMIVTYIQAFKMKMSGIPYEKYIMDQLKAIHDSGIKGFIMWNARQEYDIPLSVVKTFYTKGVSKKEKRDDLLVN